MTNSEQKGARATPSSKSTRDNWDRLEIIGKLISSVALVAIPIILGYQSEQVARAFRSGEFVHTLIEDLASPDSSVRQELALVALDRAAGDESPELVVEVCEEVYRNLSDYEMRAGKIAFRIMQRRDPPRAERLAQEAEQEVGAVQSSLISSADTSVAPAGMPAAPADDEPAAAEGKPPASSRVSSETYERIARTFENVVFIQYRGDKKRARDLQKQLKDEGWTAPGVERVVADYANSVRYFHEEDQNLATQVAALANDYLHDEGIAVDSLEIQALPRFKSRVSRGQIEVWLNLNR